MSLNAKLYVPRLLLRGEKYAIEDLAKKIKSLGLTSEEIEKINEKTGSPIIPEAHPVIIDENENTHSTEVYIGVGRGSDESIYVEATPQNRKLVRKIEDIVFRK